MCSMSEQCNRLQFYRSLSVAIVSSNTLLTVALPSSSPSPAVHPLLLAINIAPPGTTSSFIPSLSSSSPTQQFIPCYQHCTLRTTFHLISPAILPSLSADSACELNILPSLSTDSACELKILGHDGHTLGVDGAEVGVLKEAHMIGLGGLLYGKHC